MTTRDLRIKLSDGTEELSVHFTGTACEVDDFKMAVVNLAKLFKAERKIRKPKEPCGCGGKDAN